ncbi:MAG: type II secretion system F family protein [Candidatus Moranbacteria bacterium]|nr:type II secretion system F family protein [Candidatus Moranbacteria bacterium]
MADKTKEETQKITLSDKESFLQKYQTNLKHINFQVNAMFWIVLSVLCGLVVGVIVIVTLPQFYQAGIILIIVITDLMVGYPYIKAGQRIDEIERNLPDALKQMADTLRAGGTYEYALREIATTEYGPLKKELNAVLRKLEEGENFESAFSLLATNVDSKIIKRTITIIIDSVRSGAGLADILDEISEDVREAHRIEKERKTKTLLQVIFMVVAGSLIAPAIFGFVSTISSVLINAAARIVTEEEKITAIDASNTIQLGIQIYLFFEILAASAMMALMREGKLTKTIIYMPILLLIGYFSYTLASIFSKAIVGNVAI